MKILLCPDSFKGSLSSPDAARAMETGLRRVWPDADIVRLPLADGGEGTLHALLAAGGEKAEWRRETVRGPLGEAVRAAWGWLPETQTAVVELAQAAGLSLVPDGRRDPKITTTFGVGQLLLSALREPNVRRVVVGLGGSATNDGGAGLLCALGVRFLDDAGRDLPPGGAALAHLVRVDTSGLVFERADGVQILIACDVENPLTGPNGASAVFGPQKGATPDDVALLDNALARFARVWEKPHDLPGMGAAGGTAFGLLSLFPHAQLKPGIGLVLDATGFNAHLVGANLVLTGEGKMDAQTLGGKAVAGIARRVHEQTKGRVPVAALVGAVGRDVSAQSLHDAGIAAVMPLSIGPETLADALPRTAERLADAAERSARWILLGGSLPPSS